MFNYFKNCFIIIQTLLSGNLWVFSKTFTRTPEFNKQLKNTLFNKKWVNTNKEYLLLLFPEIFTHQDSVPTEPIVEKLKSVGLETTNDDEFALVIYTFEHLNILVRDKQNKYLIKRNVNFGINIKS